MKNQLTFFLLAGTCAFSFSLNAQQPVQKSTESEKITPGMTEVWDPEVKIIQPGEKNNDAPSDAIILFNGNDVSQEWTRSEKKYTANMSARFTDKSQPRASRDKVAMFGFS